MQEFLLHKDYYGIRIETLLPVVKSYSTDFTNASAEFFNYGFEIAKPQDFRTSGPAFGTSV